MIVVHSQTTFFYTSLFSGKEYRVIILVGVSSVSFGAIYITIISIINFHHSLNSFEEISCFVSVAGKAKL